VRRTATVLILSLLAASLGLGWLVSFVLNARQDEATAWSAGLAALGIVLLVPSLLVLLRINYRGALAARATPKGGRTS